jgi:hypothetical protein
MENPMSQIENYPKRINRETLYAELWQIPGTQLARKYGVSDVAIGKACRRHDIPRPPPGYWTMRRHGYEVEQTPLPPISDERLRHVEFHPLPLAGAQPGMTETGSNSRTPIQVSEQLRSPHTLVEEARKQLRAATGGDNRIVATDPQTALNIAVANASITRALKIMDALIKAWEEVGGMVRRRM